MTSRTPTSRPRTPASHRARRSLRTAAGISLLLAVPVVVFGSSALATVEEPAPAAAGSEDQPFDQSVRSDGTTTTWSFSLKDGRALDHVGVHYTPTGKNRQSFEMTPSADGRRWTFTRPAAATTGSFTYFFVYKVRGTNVNAPTTPTYDHTGRPDAPDAPGETPPPASGSFPLRIAAKGAATDSYVTVVGQATPGHYSYVTADGTVKPVTDQPQGMSFPLASADGGRVTLPAEFQGGRIFFSKKPMTMPAPVVDGAPSDTGYVQPDLNNPSDPNQGNPYDFFEFTFKYGAKGARGIAFGGNTSQVDGFSLPMTAELEQESSGTRTKVGIEGRSAAQVIDAYRKYVGDDAAFASLVDADGTHITAPRSAKAFQSAAGTYFDGAVDTAWTKWKDGFELTDGVNSYEGRTEGDRLSFRKLVGGEATGETGAVAKPSTADIAACAGTLSQGTDTEKFIEAHLCAAFNRGIAQNDPATWNDKATYYAAGTVHNKYAAFFHRESLGGLAYGFAYDDVHDQSSVMILPNADAPTRLTLTVGG